MALAGLVISLAFKALGWVPARHAFNFAQAGPAWNYTTALNLVFAVAVLVLLMRFLLTGGVSMLRAMNRHPEAHEGEMSGTHSH